MLLGGQSEISESLLPTRLLGAASQPSPGGSWLPGQPPASLAVSASWSCLTTAPTDCRGFGIMVVTIAEGKIASITGFPDQALFPVFGLRLTMPGR